MPVQRPMTDNEYAQEREQEGLWLCPRCQSPEVAERRSLDWASGKGDETATVKLRCLACKAHWTEILRPVGYEME